MTSATVLVEFDPGRTDDLILMWRTSFESALGIRDPHPLGEQREYLLGEVLPKYDVRVAMLDNEIVGFVAASAASIAQLYVRCGFQRRGIGTQLLAWAKQQSSGSLWLYTFARNLGARTFYERHGFTATAYGFEPSWQLDDVKYEWVGGAKPRPATGDEQMNLRKMYTALLTADLAVAERWYTKLLGRGPDNRPMSTLVQWELLERGGLMLSTSDEIAGRGVMFLYVDDVSAERRRLQGLGIELGDDVEGDYSTLAQVRDPDGNLITLATPPAKPFPPA